MQTIGVIINYSYLFFLIFYVTLRDFIRRVTNNSNKT